jgi:malate dehydrogenase (oxaloacetate-decarboxylating)(NADP+)
MLCGVVGRHEQHLKHVSDVIGLEPDAHCFAAMNMLLLAQTHAVHVRHLCQ